MANSNDNNPLGLKSLQFDTTLLPPRTPGTLGRLDAGDPDQSAIPGDTPRSLGLREIGDPKGEYHLVLPLNFDKSQEYQVFESRVLARHIKQHTKPPAKEIPASELLPVEDGHNLRRFAAKQCIALLNQARLDLEAEKEEFRKKSRKDQLAEEKKLKALGEVTPIHVEKIGITSAYRGPEYDTKLWHKIFREQFVLNYTEVQSYDFVEVHSGPKRHRRVTMTCVGPVDKMLRLIAHVKAAPGYSNHTNGIAVDFFSVEGKKRFAANPMLKGKALEKLNRQYEKTWFYRWLEKHKDEYGIKREYSGEAWHWDFIPPVKGDFPIDKLDQLRRCV